jgi:superfamily I DNA/RNA helicase
MRRIKSYIDGDLAKCRLDNNIRNGKDTALNAVSLGAFTQPPFRISSDRNYPVVKDVYKSEDEQIEKIKKIFHNFKSDKIKPESIIILSRNKYENSVISKIESGLPKITQYDQDPYDKNVKYSTIHSYKGLEADHVVLIEIDDLTSKKSNSLFYTGATRAVHSLHILISDIQDRLFTANFFDVVEMYR